MPGFWRRALASASPSAVTVPARPTYPVRTASYAPGSPRPTPFAARPSRRSANPSALRAAPPRLGYPLWLEKATVASGETSQPWS